MLIALLAVLTPVYRILVNTRIPFLLSETLILLAVMLVIAVVVGLALRLSGRRGRLLILTAILFVHLDLAGAYTGLFGALDLGSRISGQTRRASLEAILLLLIFGGLGLVLWTIRRQAMRIAAAYFVVVALATIAMEPLPRLVSKTSAAAPSPTGTATLSDGAPPLVIHLLFDGLLAPAAIRRDIAGGDAVYGTMHHLAAHYGFRVFERAFSRHRYTAASLSNMMNAEYTGRGGKPGLADKTRIEENAYFDDYAARGYRIHVYQTSYLDFCAHKKVAACAEFDSYNPAWLIANRPYQNNDTDAFSVVTARTLNLLLTLLHSHVGNYTGHFLVRFILAARAPLVASLGDEERSRRSLWLLPRFDVPGFTRWFDDFAEAVMGGDRGTLFFAHFMVPHFPYLLTSRCEQIGTRQRTGKRPAAGYPEAPGLGGTEQEDLLRDYYAQVQCVFVKLEELLRRIERSPRHRDALIVVHGDHGSRHSDGVTIDEIRERDFIDSYATFFAVRSPDRGRAGRDCELASLPDLFARYARHAEGKPDDGRKSKTVFVPVDGDGNAQVERPMPEFPCRH
ncbi:MAG: sulfatase-like hydrolase/transferase [Candidatus Thiosymbion ectosymbiont of Robbea hypermnestra]|nr:sulfatase-like hydrolase/transferase [Candidatus Thiosymbion ectosymbiont of Robbea hypermnestra]